MYAGFFFLLLLFLGRFNCCCNLHVLHQHFRSKFSQGLQEGQVKARKLFALSLRYADHQGDGLLRG